MTEPGPTRTVRPFPPEFPAPTRATRHPLRVATTAAALALLVLWAGWWVQALRRDHLATGPGLWFPVLSFIAGDFVVHIDHTARIFAEGGDPYRLDDWICASLPYPPMIPRLFRWVTLFSIRAAGVVWILALAVIFVSATWAVHRTRRNLGLAPVPWPWLLVAVLYSTPVVVAMERGQCDPLVIPLFGLAAWLLRRRSPWADPAAGALLGLTAWIKYYPGLAIVALIALRRWRALALFVIVAGGIGLHDLDGVRRSIANGSRIAAVSHPKADLHPLQHAIAKFWPSLCRAARCNDPARLPGPIASALLLMPPLVAVGLRLDRLRRLGRDPGPLLWPTFLWLAAAATFALPYAIDYNLVFLPLALLATWDRRDPLAVPMIFGLLLLWWQPLELPIDGRILFVLKLLGLYASSLCLRLRADELAAPPPPGLPRLHFALRDPPGTTSCGTAAPGCLDGGRPGAAVPHGSETPKSFLDAT